MTDRPSGPPDPSLGPPTGCCTPDPPQVATPPGPPPNRDMWLDAAILRLFPPPHLALCKMLTSVNPPQMTHFEGALLPSSA